MVVLLLFGILLSVRLGELVVEWEGEIRDGLRFEGEREEVATESMTN